MFSLISKEEDSRFREILKEGDTSLDDQGNIWLRDGPDWILFLYQGKICRFHCGCHIYGTFITDEEMVAEVEELRLQLLDKATT